MSLHNLSYQMHIIHHSRSGETKHSNQRLWICQSLSGRKRLR